MRNNIHHSIPRETHDTKSLRRFHYPHIIIPTQYESSQVEGQPYSDNGIRSQSQTLVPITHIPHPRTMLRHKNALMKRIHALSRFHIQFPPTIQSLPHAPHTYSEYLKVFMSTKHIFHSVHSRQLDIPICFDIAHYPMTHSYVFTHVSPHVDKRFVCPCTIDRVIHI